MTDGLAALSRMVKVVMAYRPPPKIGSAKAKVAQSAAPPKRGQRPKKS